MHYLIDYLNKAYNFETKEMFQNYRHRRFTSVSAKLLVPKKKHLSSAEASGGCSATLSGSKSSSTGGGVYNGNSRVARYRALYQLVHHLGSTSHHEQIQYCLVSSQLVHRLGRTDRKSVV